MTRSDGKGILLWLIGIPIPTFLSDSGKRTYVSTTSRITSGELLKQRNGERGLALDRRFIAAG